MARGKSRTSCGSIDDTKEKNGRRWKRRDGGAHRNSGQGQLAWKRAGNSKRMSIDRVEREQATAVHPSFLPVWYSYRSRES
jgi:hypothetical protein